MPARPRTIPPASSEPADRANQRIANHLGILLATIRGQIIAMRSAPDLLDRQMASAMLHTTAAKITAVANLHRRLARASHNNFIDIGPLLVETANEIAAALPAEGMLSINQKVVPDCLVDPDQASILVLILCEIVAGSVKATLPVQLPVDVCLSCARSVDGSTVIEIAHDGVDACDLVEESRAGKAGEKLIRTLARRIGAEVTIDASEIGASYLFKLSSRLVS